MTDHPDVAIVMANYNCARFIGNAILSVLRQSMSSWELIIVDDASTDDSIAAAERAAGGDPRVRILAQATNRGPGAARNRALDSVTAPWIAVMDSDDLMPPNRLDRLLSHARESGASIVADNLLEFSAQTTPRLFLPDAMGKEIIFVSLDTFMRSNSLYSRIPPLGYLKPLIRTDIIGDLRYDESLRIAEDYFFLARLMLGGQRLLLDPSSVYLYRKHLSSISHRLRTSDIVGLIAAEERFAAQAKGLGLPVERALRARRRSLHSLLAYDRTIQALKSCDFTKALSAIAPHPHAWPLLMQPVVGRLRRLKPTRAGVGSSDDQLCSAVIANHSAS